MIAPEIQSLESILDQPLQAVLPTLAFHSSGLCEPHATQCLWGMPATPVALSHAPDPISPLAPGRLHRGVLQALKSNVSKNYSSPFYPNLSTSSCESRSPVKGSPIHKVPTPETWVSAQTLLLLSYIPFVISRDRF